MYLCSGETSSEVARVPAEPAAGTKAADSLLHKPRRPKDARVPKFTTPTANNVRLPAHASLKR